MGEPIQHVTIVGGGTAGWLTASAIARAFLVKGQPNKIRVTLIESPTIPTVGVGEASLPSLHHLMDFLGLDEQEFVRQTNAAIKLGARFHNWNHGPNGEPGDYINILGQPPEGVGGSIADLFLAFHPERDSFLSGRAYSRLVSLATDLADRGLGPYRAQTGPSQSVAGYSYHFDATELARLMRERAISLGAEHLLDDVDDVELDERGLITALQLREGGRFPVQLVIDCSGFQSLLLGKQLKVPFVPYDRYLLNDRALVVHVPHLKEGEIPPVTGMTALRSGWCFEVRLFNRVGTGYVFSSRFSDDEQAYEDMAAHLGPRIKEGKHRYIPMRLGRREAHWVGNCVAVGLSSGFIEPLEGTAIYTAQYAVNLLLKTWPSLDYEPQLAKRFSERMNVLYAEIRDFVSLHYQLGNRTDSPYWIAAREEAEMPDSLADRLDLWRHSLPVAEDLTSQHVFSHHVYTLVLIAKGFYRGRQLPNANLMNRKLWDFSMEAMQARRGKVLDAMPNHYELLQQMRGERPIIQPMRQPGPGSNPLQQAIGSVFRR